MVLQSLRLYRTDNRDNQGYIWGGFSLVTAIWSFFMVPETTGLSLEQLDFLYEQRVPTRDFKKHQFSHSVLARGEDKAENIGDA